MPVNDELGKRMKEYYENIPKNKLMRRTPVIIRIDGKAFHTFTKEFKKPFDEILMKSMQETTKYLCENIQGCVLGYTQSDEISLLLIDYKNLNSSAWFDYEVQKMCSIAASMATMAFNKSFNEYATLKISQLNSGIIFGINAETKDFLDAIHKKRDLVKTYERAIEKGAMFDARCFNIPKEEVANYFYWRQLDATRNSIQMVGQANFSDKELYKKSQNDIQNMLLTERDINWNDFPTYQKRGSTCISYDAYIEYPDGTHVWRNKWKIDNEIPIFKNDGRKYIEKLINLNC